MRNISAIGFLKFAFEKISYINSKLIVLSHCGIQANREYFFLVIELPNIE